jgi:hypothetical protein
VVEWISAEIALNAACTSIASSCKSSSLFSAQGLASIFHRTSSAHLAEYAGKVLLGFETAGDCNIQHAQFRGAQHLLCPLDAIPEETLVRRLAGRIVEDLREMRCAEPNCTRHFLET